MKQNDNFDKSEFEKEQRYNPDKFEYPKSPCCGALIGISNTSRICYCYKCQKVIAKSESDNRITINETIRSYELNLDRIKQGLPRLIEEQNNVQAGRDMAKVIRQQVNDLVNSTH